MSHKLLLIIQCTNTQGSYKCVCKPGFENQGEFASCVDIDECFTGEHFCHNDAECINTHGSFDCECRTGFDGRGFNDVKGCVDIDECIMELFIIQITIFGFLSYGGSFVMLASFIESWF